jgi:hypothetical protein
LSAKSTPRRGSFPLSLLCKPPSQRSHPRAALLPSVRKSPTMSIEDHRSPSPAGSSEANEPRKSSDYAEEESIALLPLDGSRTEGRTASSVNENKYVLVSCSRLQRARSPHRCSSRAPEQEGEPRPVISEGGHRPNWNQLLLLHRRMDGRLDGAAACGHSRALSGEMRRTLVSAQSPRRPRRMTRAYCRSTTPVFHFFFFST